MLSTWSDVMRIFLIIIFLAGIIGCAGSSDIPTHPSATGTINFQNHTTLLGYYNVFIDSETGSVDTFINRNAMFTMNLTNFLNNAIGGFTLALNEIVPGAGYTDLDLDISITHPVPGNSDFDIYDVRMIFMGNGSGTMKYNADLKYPINGIDQTLVPDPDDGSGGSGGADGYSRWFNYPEFSEGGIPLFSYTKGNFSLPDFAGTGTLNPYKYFADGLDPEDELFPWLELNSANRGVTGAGHKNTRNFYMRFPVATNFHLGYAVIADWTGLDVHPSNAPESPSVDVEVTPGVYYVNVVNNGGNLILDIDVFGWDHQPSQIFVESTVLTTAHELTPSEMTPVSSSEFISRYHVEIPADNVKGLDGNEFWIICEYDGFDYTNTFGNPNLAWDDPLASCFRFPLEVLPNPPCPDVMVTGVDLDGMGSSHANQIPYPDVTIFGSGFYGVEAAIQFQGASDIWATSVVVTDLNTLNCAVDFTGAGLGMYDVWVINECGNENTGDDLLVVE